MQGVFTAFIPDGADGTPAIVHNSFVKVSLVLATGERVTRVPAWIRYAVYDPKLNEYVGELPLQTVQDLRVVAAPMIHSTGSAPTVHQAPADAHHCVTILGVCTPRQPCRQVLVPARGGQARVEAFAPPHVRRRGLRSRARH